MMMQSVSASLSVKWLCNVGGFCANKQTSQRELNSTSVKTVKHLKDITCAGLFKYFIIPHGYCQILTHQYLVFLNPYKNQVKNKKRVKLKNIFKMNANFQHKIA